MVSIDTAGVNHISKLIKLMLQGHDKGLASQSWFPAFQVKLEFLKLKPVKFPGSQVKLIIHSLKLSTSWEGMYW